MITRAWKPLLLIAAIFYVQPVLAGQVLEFRRIPPPNANVDIANQLEVEVFSRAEAQNTFPALQQLPPNKNVFMTFTNLVGVLSSVSEIYFDAGPISGLSTPMIFNSLGGPGSFTQFNNGASPANLPQGNNLPDPFVATPHLSVSFQGNPSRGVDTHSDILGLAFEVAGQNAYRRVLQALASGDLRIGLHVRDINQTTEDDSFVNMRLELEPGGNPDLPEPNSTALAAILLSILGTTRRRA